MTSWTERQMIAITNPCATPSETLATEFYRALRIGSLALSTILTVNIGGVPVWHASISAHGPSGQLPWARLGLKSRAIIRETVIGLLAGVGTGNTRRERSDLVLHARRRLSDRELALLTAEWCAIPAVGIAGGGVPW